MGRLNRDRAQILLIGGLLLAVSIIALAVVFNSAVYTSTMAGQAEGDVSEHPVRSLQEDVRMNVRDLIRRAVRAHPNNRSAQVEYVKRNISAIERNVQLYAAETEAIVNVSWNGTFQESISAGPGTNPVGWHIENSTGRVYGNNTSDPTWAIGADNRIRNFEVNVTPRGKNNPPRFAVNFTGDDGNWYRVRFRNTSATTSVAPDVRVNTSKGSIRGTCELEWSGSDKPDYLHANFTNSTVNGEYCNAMDFFAHLEPPYRITFENGNLVHSGAFFSLTTDTQGYRTSTWPNNSYQRRLYGALIDVEYHGPTAGYNSTIAVAPGEPS